MKDRTLNVRIPKGVRQGQHIRLAKQGGAGFGEAEAGDLYLAVEFASHPLYKVEGKDVYLDLPVTPWEAILGSSIKVPTPIGAVDLKIPAKSAAGRKMRLKGRGIPSKDPGDLYVILQIAHYRPPIPRMQKRPIMNLSRHSILIHALASECNHYEKRFIENAIR